MGESDDTETAGPGRTITDEDVRGMVRELEPSWQVDSVTHEEQGTDFVATLEVTTPEGQKQVVLKAVTSEHMPSAAGRAEPRFLEFAASKTSIPVPTVFGCCDDHPAYPTPFFVLSYVEGENYENQGHTLQSDVRERILSQAGTHLAELHELGPLSEIGRLGYIDGEIQPIESGQQRQNSTAQRSNAMLDRFLANGEHTLDALLDGGYFPELADDPERFADLVPPLREYLRKAIPELPNPDPPTYCHGDYRYGNLLVDPDSGEIRAVIDWGQITALEPAHNLAYAESMLLSPERDGERRTEELRETFRTAYTEERDDWAFDTARRQRMEVYRLLYRLDAMACLPLWHQDATPDERDQREQEHRAFVAGYL